MIATLLQWTGLQIFANTQILYQFLCVVVCRWKSMNSVGQSSVGIELFQMNHTV